MVNIDRILKSQGVSKKALADRLGMTRENLHRILTGNPTLTNLQKVADALNVNLRQLFDDSDTGPNGYVEYRGTVYKIRSAEDLENLLKIVCREDPAGGSV